jgi:DNA-binding MarR family transcriptional regulator
MSHFLGSAGNLTSSKDKLYTLLKETFLLIDDGDRRFFDRYDLTVSRFYAIFHIGEEPGISMSNLSHKMLCDKSNITRIVRSLEVDGYVERKSHMRDRRTRRLFLTNTGVSVRDQVLSAHNAFNNARLDCIGRIEQENLLEGLNVLRRQLYESLQSS